MLAIMTELKTMEASIFLAQEMNTDWNPTSLQVMQTQCQQVFTHNKMATSSSQDTASKATLNSNYQPGGP